ncbi:MAG: ABC-F family ATP-binding cassette domain-containing protein [Porphyromonas sp.]|nr:ABC-F family ATP-binding cassette domain-containing protein [Porphyromonas sp.]
MLTINRLTVDFGKRLLFDDINFSLSDGEHVALVGRNGAGKSTLLKLIVGKEEPTSGSISFPKNYHIGYLPQVMQLDDTRSVYQEVERAFEHIAHLQEEVDELAQEIQQSTDFESEAYRELLLRFASKSETLDLSRQGGNYHAQIERTLIGLGFKRLDFDRPTATFSGGWRMRIELARILLQRPDLLLLDEPTNHLDIESIRWLEKFIASSKSSLILVSHDRSFVDNTTSRTIEIELGKLYDYKTNYSNYLALRAERIEQQRRAYENQQKMIKETEDFIERFRYKATKAVQVQSRIKQLEKVKRISIDETDNRSMNFSFRPATPSGAYPIVADNMGKAFGSHQVFDHASFTIKRGEKVAFVGRNGEGKTTMVRCIMGQYKDYTGELTLGHNVELNYFAQNEAQELNPNLTIFETIDREATGEIRTKINDLLGAFMFGGEESEKKVGMLSGGERARLAIIKLLLLPANLLILDEPTNHLDIRSKDVLRSAIAKFEGTVILVSHDRSFLDGLVDKVYEFKDGHVQEYLGGMPDYLEHTTVSDSIAISIEKKQNEDKAPEIESTAQDYQQQKQQRSRRKQVEREIAKLESEIAHIEEQLSQMENELNSPDTRLDDMFYKKYNEIKEYLASQLKDWEHLSNELENL